jgi:cytochrome c553
MRSQAGSMTEQEIRDVAAYFASTMPAASADKTVGTPPAAAATCVACHGANGVGITGDYPNLGGQHADYIVQALKAYRKGTRQNAIMNGMAAALSDDDIQAIAHYFAQQSPALSVPKAPR